ncbi:MAG: isochorismatase family protein [Streptosporangiales bacterium]|nr:isochorismatase family protein [Streptosporangiales bacterium]
MSRAAREHGAQDTYRASGFTGAFTFGSRPAVVVVDFCLGFTNPSFQLGSEMGEVVRRTRTVLAAARKRGVPIVFTTIAYDEGAQAATAWVRKVPSLRELATGSRAVEIDPLLGRLPHEALITKTGASAFFGTPLASMLTACGVDTVLVAGATTSGCVRATVVDSVQHGFGTFVITDCIADRSTGPHEANLFDMTAKYADPLTAKEVIGHLERIFEIEV